MKNHPPSPFVIFYKKRKMYYEIQLTKTKMDFNNRKMTNYPPSSDPYKTLFGHYIKLQKVN